MNLNNYYWYFKSVVPPRICDDIIKHGLSKSERVSLQNINLINTMTGIVIATANLMRKEMTKV